MGEDEQDTAQSSADRDREVSEQNSIVEDALEEADSGPDIEETDVDGSEINEENVERRKGFFDRLSERASSVRGALEQGAQTEEDGIDATLSAAKAAGDANSRAEQQIEERSEELIDFAADKKQRYEEEFGEREEEMEYDSERVEELESELSDELDSMGDAAVVRGYFMDQFRSVKGQNDVFRSDTGSVNQGYLDEGGELSDLALAFEDEMSDARQAAKENAGQILDELQLDEQLAELADRKQTYDEVKQNVEENLQEIRNADTSVDTGEHTEEEWEDAQEFVDSLDEDFSGSVTTDLSEYGNPERGMRLLQTVVADAVKSQQERLYDALDTVDEVRGDVTSFAQEFVNFQTDVEDLTSLKWIENNVDELEEAGYNTILDVADTSAKKLELDVDSPYITGRVEEVVESARERVQEVAGQYGLDDVLGEIDTWAGEDSTKDSLLVKQLKGAYSSVDAVQRYAEGVESVLPDTDEYRVEWERDGETYDAEEWIEQERNELYDELGIDTADPQELLG